jgi:hypothetical protein
VAVEPAIHHDDFRSDVLQQLLHVHGVLVWHNPIPAAHGGDAPLPIQRLCIDADDPQSQDLRRRLEGEWLELPCGRVDLRPEALPMRGVADLLLGATDDGGKEKCVLCESSASSGSPFADSAIAPIVESTCRALGARRRHVRGSSPGSLPWSGLEPVAPARGHRHEEVPPTGTPFAPEGNSGGVTRAT